jgi:hypothetical protein
MTAVETFRGISWLVFKWLAITILSLIALVAVVIGGWVGVNWLTYDR